MKKIFILVIVFLSTYINNYSDTPRKGKMADGIPEYTVFSAQGCDTNRIFLATTTSAAPYILILDNSGVPLFSQKTYGGVYDFKPHPNGLLSYYDIRMDGYYILDENYNLIDSIRCLNGIETDIHELRILPNGNYLILGFDTHTVDMSRIVEGGKTSATIIGYVIQEIDRDKNIIFEWNTFDHISITDSYTDLKQATIDVAHGNSIEVDWDGNFLVSLRNTQEITKINRVTGDIIWRLGGKKNQFEFINDTLGFSWQHAARRLQNGNIMLFDNGTRREPASMAYSRALEYKLDELNKTAELVWSYRYTPNLYSIGLGYSQRLPNGNTFIAWGGTMPAITEVTMEGEKVFELRFKETHYTYRAYRYPWKPAEITSGDSIYANIDVCRFKVKNGDTASIKAGLINSNPFPVVVTSIANNERSFYIPFEFPAEIKANDSLIFPVYFKPDLGGEFTDTLRITTNYNDMNIPMVGEIVSGVSDNYINENLNFTLGQNYPNPFNPECRIEYSISKTSFVNLTVYDVLGRNIAELVNSEKKDGNYVVTFNGKAGNGHILPSGIYFYSLNVDGVTVTKKMVLQK